MRECRCLFPNALRLAGILASVGVATAPAQRIDAPFLNPPDPTSPPFASTSQHYVMRGLEADDQVMLGRWFDELEGRFEALTGRAVPFQRSEYIRIGAGSAAPAGEGSIQFAMGRVADLLQQRIYLVNPEQVPEREVADALVFQLINRCVARLQDAGSDEVVPFRVPDWLTAGTAENLTPSWRERNTRYVSERWRSGAGRSLRSVLSLAEAPRMRADERAFCGLAVEWISGGASDAGVWEALLRRLARSEALDPEWMATEGLGLKDLRAAEMEWDLWLASRTQVKQDLGSVRSGHLDELDGLLARSPRGAGPGAVRQPADLIALREEPWVRGYSVEQVMELERLAVGTAPEFRSVADRYVEFYKLLARAAEARGGLFNRDAAAAALQKALTRAEDAHQALVAEVAGRSAYLDAVRSSREGEQETELERRRREFLERARERLEP